MRKYLLFLIFAIFFTSCKSELPTTTFSDLDTAHSMELTYAKEFSIDYLSDGCSLISINESGRFLVVPQGQTAPINVDSDITILHQPIENIYLAATSAMCLFDSLDSLEQISMSGTKADGWYVENARLAMEQGDIIYAGKYSAPDYEMLISNNCGLAIESTMINHKPEVKEKLEDLGFPVLIERSSYENHPLGRTEWIKLYGVLCGKQELAAKLFDEQVAYINDLSADNTGKTVAFFYISSSGSVVARKSNDYTVKMIELAGGNYVFSETEYPDSAAGSLNMEMETFYAQAKDADIIIYNSSIDGEVNTIKDLIAKNYLLEDFKAIKNGYVWCTNKNMFQETTDFGIMISEMNQIFTDDSNNLTELNFYYRLR